MAGLNLHDQRPRKRVPSRGWNNWLATVEVGTQRRKARANPQLWRFGRRNANGDSVDRRFGRKRARKERATAVCPVRDCDCRTAGLFANL